MELHWSFR